MEELKEALLNDLIHVTEVFFDEAGNWFINKTKDVVTSKLRSEILEEKKKVKQQPKGEI